MNINSIFNKLSNEIILEILVKDSFQNYAEDKLNLIKNCSKWSAEIPKVYSAPQDYSTNLLRLWNSKKQ